MSSLSLSCSSSSSSQIGVIEYSTVVQDKPFRNAILYTSYKPMVKVKCLFDVFINTTKRHWYIMIHMNMVDSDFPYVSFEATTKCVPCYERLIPAMRVVEASHVEAKQEEIAKRALTDEVIGRIPPLPEQLSAAANTAANVIEVAGQLTAASTIASLDKGCGESMIKQFMMVGGMELKHVGTYQGTLNELCQKADSVIVRMGKYNLFCNNCQHFCNNFLCEIGLESGKQKTSIGPSTTLSIEDKTFDMSDSLFPIT